MRWRCGQKRSTQGRTPGCHGPTRCGGCQTRGRGCRGLGLKGTVRPSFPASRHPGCRVHLSWIARVLAWRLLVPGGIRERQEGHQHDDNDDKQDTEPGRAQAALDRDREAGRRLNAIAAGPSFDAVAGLEDRRPLQRARYHRPPAPRRYALDDRPSRSLGRAAMCKALMLALVEPSPLPCVGSSGSSPALTGANYTIGRAQPGTRVTQALDRGGRDGQKRKPGANERREPASPRAVQGGDRRSDGQSPAGQAGPRRSRPRPVARTLGAPQGRSAPVGAAPGGPGGSSELQPV